ncbi:hypothetical protein AB8P51_08630 [Muriicola sp. SD30]
MKKEFTTLAVLGLFVLISVNEDGKITSASDYFDVNGLAVQIAEE